MKKKFLAILISVIMLMSIMPATGLAALSGNSYVGSKVDFTSYTKNSTSSSTNTGAVTSYNGGVSVDYEPVSGVFGKAVDDVSVKSSRITTSTAEGAIGARTKITKDGGAAAAGDWIDLNWEWAFGDMNVERYLKTRFYTTDALSGSSVSTFSFTTGSTANDDILRVSPDGAIRFFGKTLDNNYYFETDTWYNFDIRIKVGTDGSSKAVAYLYIDGILVGQKEINNEKDSSTNITNPKGIFAVDFISKAVKLNGGSEAQSEVTYLDNIFASVFKENNYSEFIPALRDYTITSKSDNFITDGIHIALKNSVTVGELMEDLSYVADSVTGIKTIQIADSNRVDINDDNAIVYPGCFIHAITVSGESEHHWYRKIVDNITYISNDYDNGMYSTQPTDKYSFRKSDAGTTYDYVVSEKYTADSLTRAMMVDKYGTNNNIPNVYFRTGYAGTIDSSKYVVETKILREPISSDYPALYLRVNNQRWLSVSDDEIAVLNKQGNWSSFITKDQKLSNRWVKVALEFDTDLETAKIYINGEYTGAYRSITAIPDWYSKIDIALDFTDLKDSALGKSYMDDVKIYSGTYVDEEMEVVSTNDNIKVAANDTFKVQGDVTAEELIAATGADTIYAYSNGQFSEKITSGTLPENAVAIIKDEDSNIVRYFDLIYSSFIGDVEFDTSVAGKISANVIINNKSELDMFKNAKLIIAAYDSTGAIKELSAINMDEKNNLVVGENKLTATIDYSSVSKVVVFIWNADNAPYCEPIPYNAD